MTRVWDDDRVDDTLTGMGLILGAIFVLAMVGVLFMVFFTGGFAADDTCPEYGEVPVLIENDTICVPWEKAAELEQYRN